MFLERLESLENQFTDLEQRLSDPEVIRAQDVYQKLMREHDSLDWPRLAQEFHDIGYRGWYVLETRSPSGDLAKDTRDNIEYVRQTFRIPA